MKTPMQRTKRLSSIFLDETSYKMTFGLDNRTGVPDPGPPTPPPPPKSEEDEEVSWIWEKLLFYPVGTVRQLGRVQLTTAIASLVLLMTCVYFRTVSGILKLAIPITYMTSGMILCMSSKVPSLNSVTATLVMGLIDLVASTITILYANGPFYHSPDVFGAPWVSDMVFGFLAFAFVILTILGLVQVVLGIRSLCFMCHMAPLILSRQAEIMEAPTVRKPSYKIEVPTGPLSPSPVHDPTTIYHIHPHPPPAYIDEDC